MLSDRITTLFHLLGCNNSDIARTIGCSPSNISRIHSGRRVYKPQDRPILHFAEGVYIYADENNLLAPLCALCRTENDGRDVLIPALIAWLFDASEGSLPRIVVPPAGKKKARREQKNRGFGERFSEVMELLEMSNIRLARQINADASHISRFRNGVRAPRANSTLSKLLAETLLKRAAEQNRVPAISKATGIPADVLTDEEEGLAAFSAWLYDVGEEPDTSDIDRLLDCIDSFSSETKAPLPDLPPFPADGETTEYWGIDGLRAAVARFLGNTVKQGGELWLYSDEDIDWMVGDPAFFAKWYALMLACVKRGTKVRIIHHLDRGTEEMVSAIQSWMPLYMSGMIESYVCRRGQDARFSRTVFLRPGAECVRASHVKGAEPRGWYEYLTDSRKLSVLAEEYEMLLSRCEPLVKIHLETGGRLFTEPQGGGSLSCMLSGLSLGTMPEGLVDALLERGGVTGEEARRITDFCREQRNIFKTALANGGVCEFTPLPKDDELFAGTVRVNLSPSLCERDLYYTPDEYAVHVKAISELLESSTAYRFYVLPEPPFPDIQIIRSDGSATVFRSRKPYAAFVFTEPVMLRAFESYFDVMGVKYKCGRGEVRQMLRRFM